MASVAIVGVLEASAGVERRRFGLAALQAAASFSSGVLDCPARPRGAYSTLLGSKSAHT